MSIYLFTHTEIHIYPSIYLQMRNPFCGWGHSRDSIPPFICLSYLSKFAWPPAKGVSKHKQQSPILVTVPFGYWTPGFLEFRKDTIYSILRRGGLGFNPASPKGGVLFLDPSKITPEIAPVFHRFWKPKCSQNPSKNHSKSIPGAISKPTPKKSQNYTEPNPSKP